MPIKREDKTVVPSKRDLEKGYARLIFDLGIEKADVTLSLTNGMNLNGRVLDVGGDMVVFEAKVDRNRQSTCYVHLSKVVMVSLEKAGESSES